MNAFSKFFMLAFCVSSAACALWMCIVIVQVMAQHPSFLVSRECA